MGSAIDDNVANIVIAQLLFLESEDPTREISLYVNSPGGYITSGLAIYDTHAVYKVPCGHHVIGQAASMAAVLLGAGEKGKRYALPHSRVLIHQPLGGAQGQATDIGIQAREILRTREELNDILSRHTDSLSTRIVQDTERDFYMTATQAVEYGIIDEIVEKRK